MILCRFLVDKNNKRLQVIKRAVSYLNNGEQVYFANYDYRKNLNLLQKSKADYDVASGLAKSLFSKKLF